MAEQEYKRLTQAELDNIGLELSAGRIDPLLVERLLCEVEVLRHELREGGRKRSYHYPETQRLLRSALGDLQILAGDKVGPADVSWQDVAATCAINLRVLASRIEEARHGNALDGPAVFPSPLECIEVRFHMGPDEEVE